MSGSEDKNGGFRRGAGAGSGGSSGRGGSRGGSHGGGRGGDSRREQGSSGGGGNFGGRDGGSGKDRRSGGYRDDRGGKPRRDAGGRGQGGDRRPDRPNDERGSRKFGHQENRGGRREDGPHRERRDFDDRRGNKSGSNRGGSQRSQDSGRRGYGDRPQRDDQRQNRDSRNDRGKPRFDRDDRRRGDGRDKPRFEDRKRDARAGGDKPGQRRDDRQYGRNKGTQEQATNEAVEPQAENVAPELPEDVEPSELHGEIRREMRSLPKGLADKVAKHLVAAGKLMETDPEQALVHARYARHRASRIASVREANGLTAYQMGEWNEALSELRAARRMAGGAGHLAIMADCERALGRPERAIELSRSSEAASLEGQEAVELRIVAAGARRDCGEVEASVVALQTAELDPQQQQPWSARLFYAYADNLLAADRVQEAFTWFVHAAHADDEGETDAPERLDELVVRLGGPELAQDLVDEAEESLPDQPADASESDRGSEAQ